MKILYHHRTLAEDGQAVHIRALQRAFEDEGHTVFEVGLVRRGAEPAETAAPAQSRWSLIGRAPRFARELAEYGYSAVGRGRILACAAEVDPDFIYERYAFGNAAGIWAARRARLPLVLEVNSPMVLELSRTRGLSFPRVAERMERYILGTADRVCAVSEVLREMLIELGVERERTLVTPNGVHLEDFGEPREGQARLALRLPEAREPGEVVLGFVGYYRTWHRLDLVVDALAEPALAGARLVLVGAGPAHAELAARAQARGVAARVHFAGARPHGEIPGLLAAFDVALVPAINPYASPLKLHEYMAAGLATIAPDQPNLRETLTHGENALLVPPGDAAELCAAIARLVGDAALRTRLGARAKQTIAQRDMTWRGNARRVVAAVQALGKTR